MMSDFWMSDFGIFSAVVGVFTAVAGLMINN
jgi:hypothetical protein